MKFTKQIIKKLNKKYNKEYDFPYIDFNNKEIQKIINNFAEIDEKNVFDLIIYRGYQELVKKDLLDYFVDSIKDEQIKNCLYKCVDGEIFFNYFYKYNRNYQVVTLNNKDIIIEF